MPPALLALLLPSLFWDRPVATADILRQAGIDRLYVPAAQEPAWRKLGFSATAFDRARAVQAVAPNVEYHMDVASATRVPWIDANGWRYQRAPAKLFFCDASAGGAALAAAEAFAYGVAAAIRVAPAALPAFARMSQFLRSLDAQPLPARANIAVIDDGSDIMGEILNLLARHNLLFRIVPAADSAYDIIVRDVPKTTDPYEFAINTRHSLGDEKRLLRIYGSNLVLGRLTGDTAQTRVDLLNYGNAAVKGLRVRVLGEYPKGKLAAFEHAGAALADYSSQDGATEFTIPELGAYAVVDLRR